MCVQATFAQVWFAIKCMIQHPNVCWLSHGISILKKKEYKKKLRLHHMFCLSPQSVSSSKWMPKHHKTRDVQYDVQGWVDPGGHIGYLQLCEAIPLFMFLCTACTSYF